MLREFVEKKHYKFAEGAADWRSAIRMSCECLEADGTVEANYKEDIIACVEKHGSYIVIMPNVAIPHSQEGASGVNKTAISFMRLAAPVSFEEGNPEKDVQLFFTLASCNPDQHLENMTKLSRMLMNDQIVKALVKASSSEELLAIQKLYLDTSTPLHK